MHILSCLVKAGVFYSPEDCVAIVGRLLNGRNLPQVLPQNLIRSLEKEIKGPLTLSVVIKHYLNEFSGLKLKVTHIGHKITCSGLMSSADQAKFVPFIRFFISAD